MLAVYAKPGRCAILNSHCVRLANRREYDSFRCACVLNEAMIDTERWIVARQQCVTGSSGVGYFNRVSPEQTTVQRVDGGKRSFSCYRRALRR